MSSREERKRKIEALNNAKKYGGTGYPVEIVDPNTGRSVVVKPGSAAYSEFFKTKNNVVATPATVDKALDILKEDKKKAEIKLEKAIEKSEQKRIQQSDDPVEKPVQKGTKEFTEKKEQAVTQAKTNFEVPGSGSLAPDSEFDYVGTRVDNTNVEQQEGRTFAEVQSDIGKLDKNDQLLESDEASLANHARRQAKIHGRGSDEHKAALEARDAKTLERKENQKAKEALLEERKDIVVQQAEDNVEEAAKEVAEIDEKIEEAEAKENNTETVETPDLPPEDEPPVVVTDEPLPDIQEQEEDDGEEETAPEETAPEETAPEEEPEPPTTTEELIEESPEPETPDTKKKKKTHVPPIIIQHPEDGKFQIGRERPEDDNSQQKIQRLSDVLLEAGSAEAEAEGGSVKLFHDGGFELKSGSGDSGIQGCQIMQMCEDAPLIIHSKGNIIIDCEGTFAVTANDIQMRAKNRRGLEKGWNQSGSINLKASKNIKIDADKAITVTSETVVIDAKRELLCHSEGFNFLIGRVVRIHEPRSKLIPATLKEVLDKHLKPFRG